MLSPRGLDLLPHPPAGLSQSSEGMGPTVWLGAEQVWVPGHWGSLWRDLGELDPVGVEPGEWLLREGRLLIQLPPSYMPGRTWGSKHNSGTKEPRRAKAGRVPVSQLTARDCPLPRRRGREGSPAAKSPPCPLEMYYLMGRVQAVVMCSRAASLSLVPSPPSL